MRLFLFQHIFFSKTKNHSQADKVRLLEVQHSEINFES